MVSQFEGWPFLLRRIISMDKLAKRFEDSHVRAVRFEKKRISADSTIALPIVENAYYYLIAFEGKIYGRIVSSEFA